jgi:hypothetical protein
MLKTKMTVKLACGIALVLGTAAMAAQQTSTPAPAERGGLGAIRKVSTLIGTPVVGPAESTVAHVRDLALSPAGDVLYVVLGYGGLAGVGETNTAAPLDALEIRHASDGKWGAHLDYIPVPWSNLGLSTNLESAAVTASIEATKAQFEKAPRVKGSDYATLLGPGFADEVRRYFGAIGRR